MMYHICFFSQPAFIISPVSWVSMAVSLVAVAVAFVLFKIKKNKLMHENKALQQRITEYSERLEHAIENERKAKESIDVSQRSKTALLSKLSHEIRTPMNGVIGMASLLSETNLTEEQKEYTGTIVRSSDRLMATIDHILVTDVIDYSKNEADRAVLEEKDYDLRYNIETALESFARVAAQQRVELVYSINDDVPDMLVGDEMRLRQIIMNLVENAMRFTTGGEIVITVSLLRLLEGNQADLSFEVKDNGTALPQADIDILSKDIEDISTKEEGNALPLMICKKLVGLLGGRLEIETGKETIIRFKIRTRTSLQPHRRFAKTNTAQASRHVLLVDDNAASCRALKKQLEQWNMPVITARSAEEAMEVFRQNPQLDLVLTDMEMGKANGIGLACELKKLSVGTPIVLLNTDGNEEYKNYPDLFSSVITKPVKQQALHDCVLPQSANAGSVPVQQKSIPMSDLGKHQPLRILVAEDNNTNQQVALKFLKKIGYEADLAQNGEEALEMVSDGNYDLIFMDVQMPVKDGLEATRLIRLCLSTQPVIIAMTANAIQGDKQKCLNAGMDDYISKPFRIEEFAKMIEKWAVQINAK